MDLRAYSTEVKKLPFIGQIRKLMHCCLFPCVTPEHLVSVLGHMCSFLGQNIKDTLSLRSSWQQNWHFRLRAT